MTPQNYATALLTTTLALVGCAPTPPPAVPAPTESAPVMGEATSFPLIGESASSSARCARPVSMVSDGEDGSNHTNPIEGRGGYWYTYTDKLGTTVTPAPGDQGGTFTMTPGGANGTRFAARMTGQIAQEQTVYAGMGLGLVNPKGPYDASRYGGISFWAKLGPGSTRNVRLKLPDQATDPAGGVCTECFNDFGEYLELTFDWKKYTFDFATMKQQSDWGKPRPDALAKNALYGITFQVDDFGRKFDVWVDEIEFTDCP